MILLEGPEGAARHLPFGGLVACPCNLSFAVSGFVCRWTWGARTYPRPPIRAGCVKGPLNHTHKRLKVRLVFELNINLGGIVNAVNDVDVDAVYDPSA